MFIGSIKLVDMVIRRYQCQYGPNDFTNVVNEITQNHNATPNINGKIIPSMTGHKDTQDSKNKWGGSIKKGCRVEFIIKKLYLLKHALELCFIQRNHVNQYGLHLHGDLKMGDKSTFATHLSQGIKDFVMEQLRLGLTLSQIIENMGKM